MRAVCVAFMLVVAAVVADETCTEQGDCDCGSVCNEGKCVAGCMVFDMFMQAGATAEVYGRKCECSADPDAEGRPIMCEENVAFANMPEGIKEYVSNPKCGQVAA